MTELDHKRYKTAPRIVKREVILDETEKYIADNWHLLENSEKTTFKRMLGKAFDFVLYKIDSRRDKKENND